MRTKLIDVMVEETAPPHRGGALHLNRLLTEEQKAFLTAFFARVAKRDAMKILKICTFDVAPESRAVKLGERLGKQVLGYAESNKLDLAYLTPTLSRSH